ncbi:RCC1 domain-containing protein [Salana multivorans]|uniref:RCC1 domain-containing protein n=1 Tax=Salana multivorans TaxID=120377 RepID=UPI0024917F02|nr:hypothetical protein [Salana multivorans]
MSAAAPSAAPVRPTRRRHARVARLAALAVLAATAIGIAATGETVAAFQDPGAVSVDLASHPLSLQGVGANAHGPLGTGGRGSIATAFRLAGPAGSLPGLVTDAAVGEFHGCAVVEGRVYCWGDNATGQLGNGTSTASDTPVPVSPNPGDALYDRVAVEVAVGSVADGRGFTCASVIAPSGGMEVYCWGDNYYGQLGIGGKPHRYLPTLVTGIPFGPSTVVGDLSLGIEYSCGVVDGQAWCWGRNVQGRLGNGTTESRTTPALVKGDAAFEAAQSARRVTDVAADGVVTCAVADARAYCWGDALWGGLGNGSTAGAAVTSARPVAVDGASALPSSARVRSVGVMYNGGCALTEAGEVFCWGNNSQGQNGRGTTGGSDAARPVKVGALAQPAVELATAQEAACVRYGDGRLACWGDNRRGQLGRGTTTSSGAATVVTMPSTRPVLRIVGGAGSFLAVQGY